MKLKLIWYNNFEKSSSVAIPLGIVYIASNLEKHGYNPEVIDLTFKKSQEIPIESGKCIYGFSSTTPFIHEVLKLMSKVKADNPEAITVLGGPHATILSEDVLKNPELDIVVIGEGEITFVKLVEALTNNKDLSKIPGIAYKDKGKIKVTKECQFIEDLDLLPFPALEQLPLDKYFEKRGTRELPIITARGCPGNCTFCQPTIRKLFGGRTRYRSPKNIVDEMEKLVKVQQVDFINFVDDTFGSDKPRISEVCDEIIRRKIHVLWRCQTRVGWSKELLIKMKKSGCIALALGVESGSQKILDNIRKNITIAQIKETFKNCRAAGILTHAYIMVGNVGETHETIEQTIALLKDIKPFNVNVSITTPYPGTDLYDWAKKEGKLITENWDKYDHILADSAGIKLDDMSHAEVVAAKEKIEKAFNESLKSYKKQQLRRAVLNKTFMGKVMKMTALNSGRTKRFIKFAYNVATKSGFSIVQ